MHSHSKGFTPAIQPGTKVLFACFPADGHFNPLTGLAMHLKSIGCDVRWYTSSHYAGKLQKLDIPHYRLKRAYDFDPNAIDTEFPERKHHRSQISKLVFDMIHAFILRGPEYYEDIRDIRRDWDFDVMIADVAFSAIPLVKEHMKKPVISVGVMPLTETSKDLPPAGLGLTPSTSWVGRQRQAVLRFIADRFLFAKPNRVMKSVLQQYGLSNDGLNLFDLNVRKASLYFQSGTPGFEYKRSDLGKNIRFIGPLLPYQPKNSQPAWYDARVKRYEKVILVTQGTVEKDASKLIVPALEAFRNTDYLVIVTTGGAGTEELRAKYAADNVIIEDFIPFGDVMPHADVYISNGGYGGVLLSIAHQLPMVVAGIHEGKNEINARIGYFGLGENLKTEKPTPAQLRQGVEKVLWDETYRNNVASLNEEFSEYDPGLLCQRYIGEIVRKKRSYPTLHMKEMLAEEIY